MSEPVDDDPLHAEGAGVEQGSTEHGQHPNTRGRCYRSKRIMTAWQAPQPYVTFEDFVASERDSETKHEWFEGVVYAMAGGSVEHGRLATNCTAALRARLAGRCTVLSSDVMVYVRETNLATYPDGCVAWGAWTSSRSCGMGGDR